MPDVCSHYIACSDWLFLGQNASIMHTGIMADANARQMHDFRYEFSIYIYVV